MILRYVTNLKVAKQLYDAAQPKLKGDQGMKDALKCSTYLKVWLK